LVDGVAAADVHRALDRVGRRARAESETGRELGMRHARILHADGGRVVSSRASVARGSGPSVADGSLTARPHRLSCSQAGGRWCRAVDLTWDIPVAPRRERGGGCGAGSRLVAWVRGRVVGDVGGAAMVAQELVAMRGGPQLGAGVEDGVAPAGV